LFGGPAEFGGSLNKKEMMDVDDNQEFYRRMMARGCTTTSIATATNESKNEAKEEKNDHDMVMVNNTLESSLSKLKVEDVSALYDMLIDSDNEELGRSFRNIISPGQVQANREFYEALKGKAPPTVDSEGEDDEGSEWCEDDYKVLRNVAHDPREHSPSSVDEPCQIMEREPRVGNERGNLKDNIYSKKDLGKRVVAKDVKQNKGSSNDEIKRDDQDINDKDDDDDDDDNNSSRIGNKDGSSDDDADDDDGDSDKDDDSHRSSDDVDGTDSDQTEESSHVDEKLLASWQASVADEETGLNHSQRSKGLCEVGTSSFRRQKDLMNSERSNSFYSSKSINSSTKNTRSGLRKDLEAQIVERVHTNENMKRELERSLRRQDSNDDVTFENKFSGVKSADDSGDGDNSNSPVDDEEPPIKAIARERGPLKKTWDVISSMTCVYILVVVVCMLAAGVIVLAVFFAHANRRS
jgi:hypothetical protein